MGKITDLREWWDKLAALGSRYGYFPNPSKTWLVTREELQPTAASTFASTGVKVTPHSRPYLGAAIGSPEYISSYVETKVMEWAENLHCLAEIAVTQPYAAFAASSHTWIDEQMDVYVCLTIPDIGHKLKVLDEVICSILIPTLTGRPPLIDLERTLLALPARLGGLGLHIYTFKKCIPCIPAGHSHPL